MQPRLYPLLIAPFRAGRTAGSEGVQLSVCLFVVIWLCTKESMAEKETERSSERNRRTNCYILQTYLYSLCLPLSPLFHLFLMSFIPSNVEISRINSSTVTNRQQRLNSDDRIQPMQGTG